MGGETAQRIESGVDGAAAAVLAGALLVSASSLGLPLLLAAGWSALGFLLCFGLLASIEAKSVDFALGHFTLGAFEPDPPELLLDDVLSPLAENSRVVLLFDPSAAPQAAPPDASRALYDALAELRRSLR